VVSSIPRPHFTPRKQPVPIVQEAGWASGPVWTDGKSRPLRDSIPDHPARSQSLYQLSYPAHASVVGDKENRKELWKRRKRVKRKEEEEDVTASSLADR